jgi:hypothetical protein
VTGSRRRRLAANDSECSCFSFGAQSKLLPRPMHDIDYRPTTKI